MDLWIFGDRGSFLNLDYLLSQHLRLGIDTYFAYGLLPVTIQHWLFMIWGRGYWPLIGCAVATFILMALFWALFLRYLPRESIWLLTLLATFRMIHWVTPNFPYSMVQLSMLFALLFVLKGRLDISLAIACIGAWSVPSLPLVLMFLLALFIILDWCMQPNRSFFKLIRSLAPGVITYVVIGLLLIAAYGWPSVRATATPAAGGAYYKAMHYGALDSSIVQFVHPLFGSTLTYITYTFLGPPAWWVLSVLSLSVFGIMAAFRMVVHRALDTKDIAIVLCAAVHDVFVLFAYGAQSQHFIYDPFLTAGMLLGLSTLPKSKPRRTLLALYIVVAILGQGYYARDVWNSWKWVRSPSLTANLYGPPDMVSDWAGVLNLSSHRYLFMLSYSSGVHNYFPTVQSANVWFLNPGQLLPTDKNRLMYQLEAADVVAYDAHRPSAVVEKDPDVQSYLNSLCLGESTPNFKIWRRPSDLNEGEKCLSGTQASVHPTGFLH